jgi:hypothetical protein
MENKYTNNFYVLQQNNFLRNFYNIANTTITTKLFSTKRYHLYYFYNYYKMYLYANTNIFYPIEQNSSMFHKEN